MLVRRERTEDERAIAAVHNDAFAAADGQGAAEARLVDLLRAVGALVRALSLVAQVDGEVGADIVGHVAVSRAELGGRPSLGLGPLGVLPRWQRRGVGSALMHAVLAAADALDAPEVVLLGDPRYYQRFGFRLAVPLGVEPPDPAWAAHFQIRTLSAWTGQQLGPFRYAAAFDLV
jgi:putative acetyltransferase